MSTDINKGLELLREEFPGAEVSVHGDRPYARLSTGEVYGILFRYQPHAGDPTFSRGPVAIVKFPRGRVTSLNWSIHKKLIEGELT